MLLSKSDTPRGGDSEDGSRWKGCRARGAVEKARAFDLCPFRGVTDQASSLTDVGTAGDVELHLVQRYIVTIYGQHYINGFWEETYFKTQNENHIERPEAQRLSLDASVSQCLRF